MSRLVLILLAGVAAVLLCAAPASAQRCVAPPGTAAVDQYCENVPSASGEGGGSGPGSTTTKPSRDTVRAIAQSGQGGEELNRYLGEEVASRGGSSDRSSNSSGTRDNSKSQSGSNSTKPAAQAPRQPSTNPLGAVQSAVNSGSTIGNGFIWALIAIALLIAGTAWVRHRRNSAS